MTFTFCESFFVSSLLKWYNIYGEYLKSELYASIQKEKYKKLITDNFKQKIDHARISKLQFISIYYTAAPMIMQHSRRIVAYGLPIVAYG